MNKVESEYEDPDKYISQLKSRLLYSKHEIKYVRERWASEQEKNEELKINTYGEHWFDYKSGITKNVIFTDNSVALKGKFGAEVWIRGVVVKLRQEDEDPSATFEISSVYIKK